METADRATDAPEGAGAPIDRIEGGALSRADRLQLGVAPSTMLIGALVMALTGLLLGWYLFHGRGAASKAPPASTAGAATSVPQRDAITEAQAREALLGGPAPGTTGGQPLTGSATTGAPSDQPLPVGMTAAQAGAIEPSSREPAAGQKPVDPRVALALASRRSPIMGFSGTTGFAAMMRSTGSDQAGEGPSPSQATPATKDGNPSPASAVANAQDALSAQLGHHVIETARAATVPDRAFLLSAGTLLPCTLQTAINSTQAGYVSCVIGHDVFSEDGRVVLLDKGTKVLGQYSGGISQGQARLFVLWTRALTPRGVAIDLGSPATDALGRSGMAGGVDTMFWQRFGGALMLSVLEDLGNVAGSHFAGAGSQTTQVPASTAGVALQNSINIRPILKKNQGDQVAIFVAKDFDFTSVYDVHVKR